MNEQKEPDGTVFIHGSLARDWAQVAEYLSGDAHDRSKVQVLVNGRFYPVVIRER